MPDAGNCSLPGRPRKRGTLLRRRVARLLGSGTARSKAGKGAEGVLLRFNNTATGCGTVVLAWELNVFKTTSYLGTLRNHPRSRGNPCVAEPAQGVNDQEFPRHTSQRRSGVRCSRRDPVDQRAATGGASCRLTDSGGHAGRNPQPPRRIANRSRFGLPLLPLHEPSPGRGAAMTLLASFARSGSTLQQAFAAGEHCARHGRGRCKPRESG